MPKWAPPPEGRGSRIVAALFIALAVALIVSWAALVWRSPLLAIGCLVLAVVWEYIKGRPHRRHLRALAEARHGESASICSFVRGLPIRSLDTWVVRATFEQLRTLSEVIWDGMPVRPSDKLHDDLWIDDGDLFEMLEVIALRSGRSSKNYHLNPFYSKVTTVADLINFVCAQPRNAT